MPQPWHFWDLWATVGVPICPQVGRKGGSYRRGKVWDGAEIRRLLSASTRLVTATRQLRKSGGGETKPAAFWLRSPCAPRPARQLSRSGDQHRPPRGIAWTPAWERGLVRLDFGPLVYSPLVVGVPAWPAYLTKPSLAPRNSWAWRPPMTSKLPALLSRARYQSLPLLVHHP